MRSNTDRFGPVAMTLHWSIAVLVLCAVVLGLVRGALDRGMVKDVVFALHKSIGLLILMLTCVRLAWRVTHPAPPLPPEMGRLQRAAAWATHGLLYVMMFAQPITGYLAEAARARETTLFWLLTVPPLGPRDRQFSHLMEGVHVASQYALYVLLLAHIGAALYHRFVLRDRILARMWPFAAAATSSR